MRTTINKPGHVSTAAMLFAGGLALGVAGCTIPMTPGPIVNFERAELHDGEFEVIEIREHVDGITYAFIAHDGVLVEPLTPEDEAWLLNPEDRREEIIKRMSDTTIAQSRRSIVPFW